MTYQCPFCPKNYKIKLNYINHVNICEFLCKPLKEQEHEIEMESEKLPSPIQMFQIIKHLNTKVNNLENDLKQFTQKEVKRFDVFTWLNTKDKPRINFHTMICDEIVPSVSANLETVFKHDLIKGFENMFYNYAVANKDNTIPICCISKNKKDQIYFYNNDKWELVDDKTLFRYFECICLEFIDAFNTHWYLPNKENTKNKQDFEEQYVYLYKKVLCDHLNKNNLFKKIKMSLKAAFKIKIQ